MLFIDYHSDWTKKSESDHTLRDIATIIHERSARELEIITAPFFSCDYSLFSLGHHPDLGFFIQARKPIERGTVLFAYGGKRQPSVLVGGEDNGSYILNTETKYALQANLYGDFGSILSHLPSKDAVFIHPKTCQTENCGYFVKNGQAFFYATQKILPGKILGCDYGIAYWLRLRKTPLYFEKHAENPTPIAETSKVQEPLITFHDAATGKPLQAAEGNYFNAFGIETFFNAIKSDYDQAIKESALSAIPSAEQEPSIPFNHWGVPTLLHLDEVTTLRNSISYPALTFFGVHTKLKGCLPPPDASFGKNFKTIVPSTPQTERLETSMSPHK